MCIPNLDIGCRWVVRFTPRTLHTQGKILHLGGPQSRFECGSEVIEFPSLSRIEPRLSSSWNSQVRVNHGSNVNDLYWCTARFRFRDKLCHYHRVRWAILKMKHAVIRRWPPHYTICFKLSPKNVCEFHFPEGKKSSLNRITRKCGAEVL